MVAVDLPRGASMEAVGVPVQKLYEPSPTPILYVGFTANVLGRVTLTEGAARLPRLQGPVAEWNEDIPRISLIQMFVIETSIG